MALLAIIAPRLCLAALPTFPEFSSPEQYGRVLLDNFSTRAGVEPVVFQHWQHRAMFSCRLCHVDVGFAMKAGATQISAATNGADEHCGACHNGKVTYRDRFIFPACAPAGDAEADPCSRCHSRRGDAALRNDYLAFAEKLPRARGGMIDWLIAQGRELIAPADTLEGVSISRRPMKMEKDVPLEAKNTWLGNAMFSHVKHALWNGCEVCHPEIFPRTNRREASFDMSDIRAGKFCGACHNKVAFPLAFCQKCHIGPPR